MTDPERTGPAQFIVPFIMGAVTAALLFGVLAWAW